jgi:starvation-inducible DNA-binding protein
MYRPKIHLAESVRNASIGLLQRRLADAVDLAAQAKQAHWNVKGASFAALHELFDRVAAAATDYGDLIAERIVALGGAAEGTVRVAAERSSLPRYPLTVTGAAGHIEVLSDALATFGGSVRAAIDAAADIGDPATADLFTEIARNADKQLWLVEAHAVPGTA